MAADTGFIGSLPYRTRNGEWALVTSREGDHYNGVLLPSELESSWTAGGNDLDGQSKYDLMELCRPGTKDHVRWRPVIERLLGVKGAA